MIVDIKKTSHVSNVIERTQHINSLLYNIRDYRHIDDDSKVKEYIDDYRKNGNIEARNKVIESNVMFLFSSAKTFSNNPEDIIDLFQEGAIGLIEAADTFDTQRDIRFLSYATHFVYKHMSRFYHDKIKMVRRSNDIQMGKKVADVRNRFVMENQRNPTNEEVIEEMEKKYGIKIMHEDYIKNLSVVHIMNDSYDGSCNADESAIMEADYKYVTKTASANEYENKIENDDVKHKVTRLLGVLTEREREVIKMFFGIGYDSEMTSDMISDKMNITQTRVNSIKKSAIQKMANSKYLIAV